MKIPATSLYLFCKGKDWHGVGHNSAYTFDGKDYLVSHAYDAHDEGKPKLIIKEITWDEEGRPLVNW